MSEAKFKKGDKIRVKSGVTPYYGWGAVKKGDVGIFTGMRDGHMIVCFDSDHLWWGKPDEMEIVEKLKPASNPAPAKWEPIPAGTKQTKVELIALANKLGAENARLKARLAKGGK